MKPVACFNIARPDEKAGSSVGGESPVAACVQRLVKATLASSSDSAFESSFMFVLDLWRRRFMEHCQANFNPKARAERRTVASPKCWSLSRRVVLTRDVGSGDPAYRIVV